MNLEEFRKALSSDATEENTQLKRQYNTRSIVEEILEMIRTKLTEVENAEN